MTRPTPDPKALRRALAARKAELRARLAEKRPPKKRRRWPWLLLLLLLLLLRCEEEPPPPLAPAAGPSSRAPASAKSVPSIAPASARPKPRRRRRLKRIRTDARPEYARGAAQPTPWLPSFRLQVAARSPRLARCFEGQREPGALRWTARIDPAAGTAADHAFEVVDGGLVLRKEAKACLTAALTRPTYRLAPEGPTEPVRVTLMIEF